MRRSRRFIALVTAFSLLLAAPVPAFAQSAGGAPPDLVKLKDGSMFRGTISELVTNDHVDIVLASGQTRRIPMKDVQYAGPANAATPAAAPPAPPPPPPPPPGAGGAMPLVTVNGPRAELRLESPDPNTTFHIKTGQADVEGGGMTWGGRAFSYSAQANAYTIICTAPCTAGLPVGTHELGLSQGGRIAQSDEPTTITGPGTLQGTYVSKAGTRVVGWIVVLGSVVGGTLLMLDSIKRTNVCDATGFCYEDSTIDGTEFGVGVGVALVGGIVGAVLAAQKDKAEITFIPGTPAATSLAAGGRREAMYLAPPAAYDARGATLQVRF
jgi:hypothetical protein